MIRNALSFFSARHACLRIRDIFRQKRCPLCKSVHKEKALLCPKCHNQIFQEVDYSQISPADSSLTFEKVYSCSPYTGTLREMILNWKFNGHLEFSSVFGEILSGLHEIIPTKDLPDILVPVPLHNARLRSRGFNQSLILAEKLSKSISVPSKKQALKRVRKTIPQSTLSGTERRKNLSGAFTADKTQVFGKSIMLVDDVMTTGSTAQECSRALLEAGAKKVVLAVLARA
jgi:ComF family protein